MSTAEVPISCVKVTPEESEKEMRATTETELEKLAEMLKTQKIPEYNNIMSESSINSDISDSDDEDYIPPKRKRNTNKAMNYFQNVETKMYNDNQKLWKKIHQNGIELNRVEKELHYTKLELNNKIIECNDYRKRAVNTKIFEEKCTRLQKDMKYVQFCNLLYVIFLFFIALDYSTKHTLLDHIVTYSKYTYTLCKEQYYLLS